MKMTTSEICEALVSILKVGERLRNRSAGAKQIFYFKSLKQ